MNLCKGFLERAGEIQSSSPWDAGIRQEVKVIFCSKCNVVCKKIAVLSCCL